MVWSFLCGSGVLLSPFSTLNGLGTAPPNQVSLILSLLQLSLNVILHTCWKWFGLNSSSLSQSVYNTEVSLKQSVEGLGSHSSQVIRNSLVQVEWRYSSLFSVPGNLVLHHSSLHCAHLWSQRNSLKWNTRCLFSILEKRVLCYPRFSSRFCMVGPDHRSKSYPKKKGSLCSEPRLGRSWNVQRRS
jgi:hypothetical protein